MFHRLSIVLLLLAVSWGSQASGQVNRRSWISSSEAARHGLTRQFVTQLEIDRHGDELSSLVLEGDILIGQSRRGVVHAIDAESGQTLWVRQIGRRGYADLPASANHQYVCVPRDTILYIVDRDTGLVMRELDLFGAASGPTAASNAWAYVPLTNGTIKAFSLLDPPADDWAYRGAGLTDSRPLITDELLCWNTTRGFVYASTADHADIRFEVTTGGAMRVALAYRKPLIYAASDDRMLYAIDEASGKIVWRLPLAEEPRHEAVVIGDDLVLVERVDGLSCIDAESGVVRWHTEGVREFISASEDHFYIGDGFGRTVVLDRVSGRALDSMPTEAIEIKYTNSQNDRLYLARPSGLIFCLHEVGLTEPLVHRASNEAPETEADPFAADAAAEPE